ncbi:site-specific integrase [Vibrio scophthalmi]|uniref:tyrosine-type recombinase/integrase n=1 Tax=Vibrio scophthalmi TaxID=45658 RepID=UPI00349FC76B
MSNKLQNLKAADIIEFYLRRGESCSEKSALQWIIEHWTEQPAVQKTVYATDAQRQITEFDLRKINKEIGIVPTGKQKLYRCALSELLCYLHDECQWTIPNKKKSVLVDKDLQWFDRLNGFASEASALKHAYEAYKSYFLKHRPFISAEFVALVIAMEVAPFSMQYLSSIINDLDGIKRIGTNIHLDVIHLGRLSRRHEETLFTRYHLPLFVYHVLKEYQQQQFKPTTAYKLSRQINRFTAEPPFSLPALSSREWFRCFQSLWYYRDNVVPQFLKDISDPERHVAFNKQLIDAKQKHKALASIYQRDWDDKWFESLNQQSKKTHWPNRELLMNKMRNRLADPTPPAWKSHNILPTMLYFYTLERIRFGGVKKSKLSDATLTKYTRIEILLESYPLPYDHAIDSVLLQQWAHRLYNSLESDTHRQVIHYFYRYMCQHSLTDHFDISEFDAPTTRPSVDPYQISLTDLTEIVESLLAQPKGHLLQRLFCAVSCILSYFAMLRRGEILRLRMSDIHFHPEHKELFYLTITKTQDGQTKNRKSRTIHTVIPEKFAKLVRILIKIKQSSAHNVPLISFNNENINSRQLHYLLPITKALKAVAGKKARFHHLRHGGIHLFLLQGLHLAYGLSGNETTQEHTLQILLAPETIQLRFSYWLEGNSFEQCNDNLLLDEIGRQIGHEYFATTRWSYLHGMDWFYPFYRLGHGEHQQRDFCHSELRYLLQLSATSNDLSRQLASLNKLYRDRTASQRQKMPISLSESMIKSWLFNRKRADSNNQQACPPQLSNNVNPSYVQLWLGNLQGVQSPDFIRYLFLQMQKASATDWAALSHVWQHSGKHAHQKFAKQQITALRNLPLIEISTSKQRADYLRVKLACNVKNAKLIKATFRQPQWQWLSLSFELTINRKTNKARQLTLLHQHYAKPGETVKSSKQSDGNSFLSIILTATSNANQKLLQHFPTFLNHLQNSRGTYE